MVVADTWSVNVEILEQVRDQVYQEVLRIQTKRAKGMPDQRPLSIARGPSEHAVTDAPLGESDKPTG